MTDTFRRFPVIAALVLATAVLGASPRAGSPRTREAETWNRTRRAAAEVVREMTPRERQRLRESLGLSAGESGPSRKKFDALRDHLAKETDSRSVQRLELNGPARIGPSLRRTKIAEEALQSVERVRARDAIIDRIGLSNVERLHVRPFGGKQESSLRTALRKSGVPDYGDVAASFDERAEVKRGKLREDVTLLRLVGGGSQPVGRYLFCCLEEPGNAPADLVRFGGKSFYVDARNLATPPGNTLEKLALVKVKAGTEVFTGVIADKFGRSGGNTQIFMPDNNGHLIASIPLENKPPGATGFMVQTDQGWFVSQTTRPVVEP